VNRLATSKATGCGSHRLLECYHYEGGIISRRDTAFKPLASAVTIASGGSAGFEGPSLLLGGGIASAIGQRLDMGPEELRVFLLAGASAGVSAIFKAPLTGILFALEIPYKRDLAREAFVPATLSSIIAYFTAVNFLGVETLFPLIPQMMIPTPRMIFHSLVMGAVAAGCAALFVKMFEYMRRMKEGLGLRESAYPLMGGLFVGVVGFFLPQVLGIGYETIHAMVSGELLLFPEFFLIALIFYKMLLTSITLNTGGSGGVFIPTIYVGAILGGLYTKLVVPEAASGVLVVAAMAATIAAANKTLLTSVAFVAETAGPSSIILTLIAAATSYFISAGVSFYHELQPMDELVEEEEAVNVLYYLMRKREALGRLSEVKVGEIMSPNPFSIRDVMNVREALEAVKTCGYRVYPIVNAGQQLIGYITLEDLIMMPERKRFLTVSHVPMRSPMAVTAEDDLGGVVPDMIGHEEDHIYVVDDLRSMRLVGVVAGMDILKEMLERV